MKFFKNYNNFKSLYEQKERELTIEEYKEFVDLQWARVNKACSIVYTKHGFFAKLLTRLGLTETLEVDTMATDGNHIYYNPYFTFTLTIDQIAWVLMHEIMHNVLHHVTRKGNRNLDKWNSAGDYAINLLLDKSDMPKGVLYDTKFTDMSADAIYDIIPNPPKPPPKPGGGGSNKGNGKNSPGEVKPGERSQDTGSKPEKGKGQETSPGEGGKGTKPGEGKGSGQPAPGGKPGGGGYGGWNVGESVDPGKVISGTERQMGGSNKTGKDLENEWDKNTREASKTPGNVSANLQRLLDELNRPIVNWRSLLKRFIKESIDKTDYQIPYKRFIHSKQYLPGPAVEDNQLKNVVIAIDTSGSISKEMLDRFITEIKGILGSYSLQDIYILPYDHDLYEKDVLKFRYARQVKINSVPGGGGTSFVPAFKWTDKHIFKKGKKLGVFIYFTDAYGQYPKKKEVPWHKQVIWFVVNNEQNKIDYGNVINIAIKDLV
jgi:predicted metal-dependent peptidase